jgi:hypothetical protein
MHTARKRRALIIGVRIGSSSQLERLIRGTASVLGSSRSETG